MMGIDEGVGGGVGGWEGGARGNIAVLQWLWKKTWVLGIAGSSQFYRREKSFLCQQLPRYSSRY